MAHVASLQPPLSLPRRDAAGDVIPWCAAHGTGVIAYSPMANGIRTDSFSRERVERLAPEEWRRRGNEFPDPKLGRNLALRDALRPVASRHATTVPRLRSPGRWPGEE